MAVLSSMTGYGRASGANGRHAVTVTLRGVNHRFLDLRLRVEELYAASEGGLRELLGARIARGRVDARVDVQRLGEREVQIDVHRRVLATLHAAIQELVDAGLVEGRLSASDLLRMPEVVRIESEPDDWDDDDQALLLQATEEALAQFLATRRTEGEQLARVLGERLDRLLELTAELERLRPEAVVEMRAGIERRLAELLGERGLDADRLAQEVALLADKTDVREELDRLGSHLGHFRALMAAPGSVGKRLDFLTQELLREINTLGAKCRNAAMTRAVLEAKTVCEQLREQVQNVE